MFGQNSRISGRLGGRRKISVSCAHCRKSKLKNISLKKIVKNLKFRKFPEIFDVLVKIVTSQGAWVAGGGFQSVARTAEKVYGQFREVR